MRILIAEKNRGFRAGFVELVTDCHPSWQIVETADVVELLARMGAAHFDLVFLDLQLPGLHAYVTLPVLQGDYPHTKFIGVGDADDRATIGRCCQDGLGGYISRAASGINLLRTLRVIATPDLFISTGSGETPRHPEPDAELPTFRPTPRPALRAGESHSLTARQSDVLTLLAEGRTTKDIARRLGLAVPTVKTHLAAVYRHLGARNRLQAVVKASTMATTRPGAAAPRSGMMLGLDDLPRTFAAG